MAQHTVVSMLPACSDHRCIHHGTLLYVGEGDPQEPGICDKDLFSRFEDEFFPALGIWILYMAGIVLFYINFVFAAALKDDSFRFFTVAVYGCLAFVVLSVGCYAYPVLSRCSMKCFEILRFSAGLMVKHFPYTFLMVLTVVLCAAAMWYVPLFTFCLPVVGTLFFSVFMEKVLIRYTPETEKCGWYAEK